MPFSSQPPAILLVEDDQLDIMNVQRELRIRASYVAAVENCDVSAFDAPSFVSGYVRSYARYLGMDPDWVFQRFCQESGFQPVHGMAPAAAGPKPTRRPADPAEALANPKALFIPQKESFWSSVEPRAIGSVLVMAGLALGLGYDSFQRIAARRKARPKLKEARVLISSSMPNDFKHR